MQDLTHHVELKIQDLCSKIDKIVVSCKACQLTNATKNITTRGMWPRVTHPVAFWEVDFTEFKP